MFEMFVRLSEVLKNFVLLKMFFVVDGTKFVNLVVVSDALVEDLYVLLL